MQLNISVGALSFENMAIRISGGRRPIGGSIVSWSIRPFRSRTVPSPTDDCESFAWDVKKSVSSSTVRSGEVEFEDSEGASLDSRAGCRERGMRAAGNGRISKGCFLFPNNTRGLSRSHQLGRTGRHRQGVLRKPWVKPTEKGERGCKPGGAVKLRSLLQPNKVGWTREKVTDQKAA